MRTRIGRATVLAALALVAMTGVAQAAPSVTGATSNSGSLSGATAVAVSGQYAYAVGYWSGQLSVLDVSNPTANPTLVAVTPPSKAMTAADNITISGSLALVTSKNRNGSIGRNDDGTGNSLTVVDISNPLAPSILGSVHDPKRLFGAYAVAVSGHYAYVASQGLLNGQPAQPSTSRGSFSVIDLDNLARGVIANIDNSYLHGSLSNGLEHATSVAISGSYAFVTAFYRDALTVIDITNPTNPVVVASLHDSARLPAPNDVAISGDYAYIANQSSATELTTVNISDPVHPSISGTLTDPTLDGAYRVRVHGQHAYVSSNSVASIAAVDISNPAAPTLAGAVNDVTNLVNVSGLAVADSGQYVVNAAHLSASVTYPPYPIPGAPGAPAGVISIIGLTTAITPASKPSDPTPSSTASFTFTASDPQAAFTCSLDGAAPGPCSAAGEAVYSSLPDASHAFTVTATDSLGLTAQDSYTWTVMATATNTVPPRITGTAQTSRTLKVSTGIWSNATFFTYQWRRCNADGVGCNPIAGQTRRTYHVTPADLRQRLEAIVTAHNATDAASASATPTKVVSWSSAAFGSSRLHYRRPAGASLLLAVPGPGGNLRLTSLVISLPKGVSFAGGARLLARGFSVKAGGKPARFKLSLSHGHVTLTFTKPPTGVTIRVTTRLVSLSSALAKRAASNKVPALRGSLSASYAGEPTRTAPIRYQMV